MSPRDKKKKNTKLIRIMRHSYCEQIIVKIFLR